MVWMVYGANGYTGRLVTALAVARGHRPILAGRSDGPLRELAAAHGLAHRTVGLTDQAALRTALSDVDLVAHCAGPFSQTAAAMLDACLATGTHYLDITGEVDVFEAVLARHRDAVDAGVALLPGSGMDVVPTDCLAATLARELPGAARLELAFSVAGAARALSPGTAVTAVEGLAEPGRARVDGRLRPVPALWRQRRVPFPSGALACTALPWGDISTAYHSTGIPNIVVYASLPVPAPVAWLRDRAAPLLGHPAVQRRLKAAVRRRVSGPDERSRRRGGSQFWAEARDLGGAAVSVTATGPDPYDLTADAVVRVAERVLAGGVRPGAWTPAQAHGTGLLAALDGVTVHPVVRRV